MAARAEEEWNYLDHLLEYVSMPNGATVDTEFVYKTRPKVYMKFRRDEDATLDIFGTKERIASCFILNLTYNKTGGGYCFYYRYGTKDNLGRSDTCTLGAPNEVVCDESAVYDGALISKAAATTSDETFAANGYPICFPAVSYPAAMSVWYFRVETNGVTTVDMVPCRKDGEVGFYDKVAGRFVAVPGGVGYGDLADDAAFVWTAGADVTVPSGKRVTVTDISAVNACSSVTIEEGGELVLDTDLPPTVPLKGKGRLVKASAATWNLSTDQSVFDGSYVIANGIVRPLVRYALGGEAASDGDIVCDGGTLNVTTNGTSGSYGSKDKQYFRLNMRRLRIRGTGFDNQGTFKCTFGQTMTRTDFAKRIDLDGDATCNVDSKSGAYFYYSRFNLHGHKLTNVSGGGWYLTGSDSSKAMVYGGGEIEQQKGKLVIRAQSYLHNAEYEEPDLGKLTLDRATLSYFDSSETSEASKPIRRPVEVKGASSISATHQFEYPNSATWDGSAILCEAPVNLTEDSKLSVSLGGEFMRYRFAGPVTGAGTLRQANRGELALEGNADTTTFDGALSLESSSMLTFLTIAHPAFMSDWAKLTVSNTFAAVAVSSNAADKAWTRDDILAVANTATLAGSDAAYETSTKYPATIAVDTTAAEDGMYDFPLADADITSDTFGLGKYGTGTMTLSGAFGQPGHRRPTLGCYAGTLKLTGADEVGVGPMRVAGLRGRAEATVLVKDAKVVCTNDIALGGFAFGDEGGGKPARARLRIENSVWRTEYSADTTEASGSDNGFLVGYKGDGILEIGEGAIVTNCLKVGMDEGYYQSSDVHGAVYQTGGRNVIWGGYSSDRPVCAYVGCRGYGYYRLDGGEVESYGYLKFGFIGRPSSSSKGFTYYADGLMEIDNGCTWKHRARIHPTSGKSIGLFQIGEQASYGHVLVKDGTLDVNMTLYVCSGSCGGIGVLTAGGPNAEVLANGAIYLGSGTTSTNSGYVALYDGVVEGNYFYVGTHETRSRGTVCFNGGTFRCHGENAKVFHTPQQPKVLVGPRGGTIDTNGKDGCTVDAPIVGATKGVLAIDVPEALRDVTLIGPPAVVIESETGDGAVAAAVWDKETGKVTGITVYAPGDGYEDARALFHYGRKLWTNETVTVGVIASGAFAKRGEGTLTLNATNTWQGATVLAGGKLKLGVDNAIPATTTFVLAGGTLDMNGKTLGDGAVTAMGACAVDVTEALAGNAGTYAAEAFAEDATLTVENVAQLPDFETARSVTLLTVSGTVPAGFAAPAVDGEIPEGWLLRWVGNALKAIPLRGTMLIVK